MKPMQVEQALEQRAPRPKRRQRHEPEPAAAAENAVLPQISSAKPTDTCINDGSKVSIDKQTFLPAASQAVVQRVPDFSGVAAKSNTSGSKYEASKSKNRDSGGMQTERRGKHAQTPIATKQHQQKQPHGKSELLHFDSYMQVATTDACDSTPCIYLRAGNKRIMFNASEGLQRVLGQYKMVSMPKIDAYFITRVSTSTLAGLPGMLMGSNASTAAANALLGSMQYVDVYGPTHLQAYVKAFLPYVNSAIGCTPHELDCSSGAVAIALDPIMQAPELTVTPIVLRPTQTSAATTSHTSVKDQEEAPNVKSAQPTAAQAEDGSTSKAAASSSNEETAVGGTADGVLATAVQGSTVSATNGLPAGAAETGEEAKEQRPGKRRRTDVLQAPPVKSSKSRDVCVSYLIKLADRPGKFNPKKAAQLGVPRGPLYGELQKGNPVVGANQRLVHPHEVLEGGTPGPVTIIVDCPTLDYLPSYVGAAALKQYQVVEEPLDASPKPHVVICHVGPLSVVQHPDYQSWMSTTWAAHCHHLVPSHPVAPNQPTYLHRSSLFQAKLHQLDNHVFPLPVVFSDEASDKDGEVQNGDLTHVAKNPGEAKSSSQIHSATIGTKFTLYPPNKAGLDNAAIPLLSELKQAQEEFLTKYKSTAVSESLRLDNQPNPSNLGSTKNGEPLDAPMPVTHQPSETAVEPVADGDQGVNDSDASYIPLDDQSAVDADQEVLAGNDETPECLKGISRNVLEVVFLGTASAMPGTYRNVSGTLVNMFDLGCFMVDCGEDSWPQVRRRYGEEAAEQLLRRLQFVWVSHMHADHHGGLYPLLQSRRRLLGRSAPPLLIIGPHSLARVLYNYHSLMPMRYAFVPSPFAEKDDFTGVDLPRQTLEVMQKVKDTLRLKTLRTFKVDHGCAAHGLQLAGQAGWKVVFSGDTQPCAAVEEAAQGATLLVHEATFEDDLEHEARMRHHSTVSEALQVARKAGAYRVALTHFSQRYPKLPSNLNAAALKRAFFAFDYTSINLADLERLPAVVPSWDHLCQCLTADEPADAPIKD